MLRLSLYLPRRRLARRPDSLSIPRSLCLLLFSLPFCSAGVRLPINQRDPDDKIRLITGDPYYFINVVKYCHHYPDLMCYPRIYNGYTSGDESAWTVSSCSDSSGLGSVRIRFPSREDSETDHNWNGLFHDSNRDRVVGMHVVITSFNPYVRFHPGATGVFYAAVPFSRWSQDLFIDFSGPRDYCFKFVFQRFVVWSGDPPPYVPPENEDGHHDEL